MYNFFLFLHIIGVIVWLGGALTLALLNLRLAREPSPAVRDAMTRAGEFIGSRFFGPAAALTLIAGVVMVGMAGWIMPAWVIWGLVGLFASGFIGAVFIGRTAQTLTRLTSNDAMGIEPSRINALHHRLTRLSTLNLLILLSVVWAMVFKPA